MGKRLNDTAAVASMKPYESQSEHYSRTVRKIDNGYVTSHHESGPNCGDGPTSKEVFTSEHPDMASSDLGRGGDSLRRAVDFMKK